MVIKTFDVRTICYENKDWYEMPTLFSRLRLGTSNNNFITHNLTDAAHTFLIVLALYLCHPWIFKASALLL